ncbi:MAG TPA: SAM-dependent methyltransferase [Planctomycetales bacterium]|jgi:trans-aconitate methyltransferase|nr:SAM-dependent methyltransferase [Planctomycetales bacterium]
MSAPNQGWDAGLYNDKHAFVWQYGASLVGLLAPKAGERILDLGCGTGHLTAQIAQAGATVVGLDHSAEMLEQARSAYPLLQFIQGDARDFTFAEPFDAIFSNAVLHWIQPPEAVIRCVRDALRPGGRFVAEFGGRGNVRRVLAVLRDAAEQMGIAADLPQSYFPSLSEYATLLEAAGLEVQSALLFDRPTPLERADGLRDWVKMFRRPTLESLPAERREEFLQNVEEAARPQLFRDGGWVADYRRLRVVAVRC